MDPTYAEIPQKLPISSAYHALPQEPYQYAQSDNPVSNAASTMYSSAPLVGYRAPPPLQSGPAFAGSGNMATWYPSAPPVYVIVGGPPPCGLAEEFSNNDRIYRDPSSWRCGHYYGQGDTRMAVPNPDYSGCCGGPRPDPAQSPNRSCCRAAPCNHAVLNYGHPRTRLMVVVAVVVCILIAAGNRAWSGIGVLVTAAPPILTPPAPQSLCDFSDRAGGV